MRRSAALARGPSIQARVRGMQADYSGRIGPVVHEIKDLLASWGVEGDESLIKMRLVQRLRERCVRRESMGQRHIAASSTGRNRLSPSTHSF